MKKEELAARLASEAGLSPAAAADQLDQMIHDILASLRSGKPAPLPGLGRFVPPRGFQFEPESPDRRRKK
jgi:nucleoid DNA-binding protein